MDVTIGQKMLLLWYFTSDIVQKNCEKDLLNLNGVDKILINNEIAPHIKEGIGSVY